MAAGRGRSVRGVNETRPRRASGREVGSERPDDPRDDWLGDVSDDDWSAGPTETVSRPRPSVPDDGFADEPVSSRPARTSGANRSAVARRRLIAGALLVGLIGLAGVVAVVLLRGDDSSTTPVSQPVASPTTTQTTVDPDDAVDVDRADHADYLDADDDPAGDGRGDRLHPPRGNEAPA